MFTPLNSLLPVYYINKIGARCENLDFLSFLHINRKIILNKLEWIEISTV